VPVGDLWRIGISQGIVWLGWLLAMLFFIAQREGNGIDGMDLQQLEVRI
jgi:hypothetical protein